MSWLTRRATSADLEALVELARRRRERYAEQQPRFWRPAPDAVSVQRSYFHELLACEDVGAFVVDSEGRVRGFVIASVGDAPPVYDPGGATCMVDDFVVDQDSSWATAGSEPTGEPDGAGRRRHPRRGAARSTALGVGVVHRTAAPTAGAPSRKLVRSAPRTRTSGIPLITHCKWRYRSRPRLSPPPTPARRP